MQTPFFYIKKFDAGSNSIVLDNDTSKHIVQVLRMKKGEKINLTDGKGNLLSCIITEDHKKHCVVEIKNSRHQTPPPSLKLRRAGDSRLPSPDSQLTIAISLLKNTSRFEWFLEKVTEIGVSEIIPLVCERTEKQKFRFERMQQICISAMLQSQQCWLPVLQQPEKFENFRMGQFESYQKFIAHCHEGEKKTLSNSSQHIKGLNSIILIGPEGDFTKEEVELAMQNHFAAVSLGETRLRSETAGIVAAAILKNAY